MGCLLVNEDFLDEAHFAKDIPRYWRKRNVKDRWRWAILLCGVLRNRRQVCFLACLVSLLVERFQELPIQKACAFKKAHHAIEVGDGLGGCWNEALVVVLRRF